MSTKCLKALNIQNKAWKRRWLVIQSGKLMWYKKKENAEPSQASGIIPILLIKSISTSTLFGVSAFSINTVSKSFIFRAKDINLKKDWLFSLQRWIAVCENSNLDHQNSQQNFQQNSQLSHLAHLQNILLTPNWWKKLSSFEEKPLLSQPFQMPIQASFHVKKRFRFV